MFHDRPAWDERQTIDTTSGHYLPHSPSSTQKTNQDNPNFPRELSSKCHNTPVAECTQVESMFVGPNQTILDCLSSIERGGNGVALVVDGSERLIGLVTDGDVRRALIGGCELSARLAPIVRKDPLVVTSGASRAHVLDVMKARRVGQVPIVDTQNRVLGVHLLSELVGATELPNVAVVMAGGLGSRLGALTRETPKPMLTVAGRPILEWIVLHLVGQGIRQLVISIGYLSDQIERHFGDGDDFGCTIQFVRDPVDSRLGSGGALGLIDSSVFRGLPVLVMNGDLITQFDLLSMLRHHKMSGASMTVARRTIENEVPFGVLNIGVDGSLLEITEKPRAAWTVNAGIYVVNPSLVSLVDTSREFAITELVTHCLANGQIVATWEIDGDWIDVGRPASLSLARGED